MGLAWSWKNFSTSVRSCLISFQTLKNSIESLIGFSLPKSSEILSIPFGVPVSPPPWLKIRDFLRIDFLGFLFKFALAGDSGSSVGSSISSLASILKWTFWLGSSGSSSTFDSWRIMFPSISLRELNSGLLGFFSMKYDEK